MSRRHPPIEPSQPGCISCDEEPLLEMPFEVRRRTAFWACWQFHVAMHNLGREILAALSQSRWLTATLRWLAAPHVGRRSKGQP